MGVRRRGRKGRGFAALGASTVLLGALVATEASAGAVPGSVAAVSAAVPCSGSERVVWVGETPGGEARQIAFGDPATGSVIVPTTGVSSLNGDPIVSPDGGHVAWIGKSALSGAYEVFVADALGGAVVRVAPGVAAPTRTLNGGTVMGGSVLWSFDGARLAWKAGADVVVARADGSAVEVLTQAAGATPVAWSKDGALLAWQGAAGVRVGPPVPGASSTLVASGSFRVQPDAFSPDGSLLLTEEITVDYFPVGQVKVFPVAGGAAVFVGAKAGNLAYSGAGSAGWSPDGGRAAAWSRGLLANPGGLLGQVDGEAWGTLATFDGSAGKSLVGGRDLVFSPEGRFLAGSLWSSFSAVAGSSEHGALGVWNRNGTFAGFLNRFPYIANRYVNVGPAWSPDGSTVAFERHLHNRVDYYGFVHWDYGYSEIMVRDYRATGLLRSLGTGHAVAWGRSGAFLAAIGDAAYPLSYDRDGVVAVRPDGSGKVRFTGPIKGPAAVATTSSATADLSVTVSGPATVAPGDTAAFTVTVTNDGPCTASGVAVSGLVGADLFATAQGVTRGTAAATGWAIGPLAPGESAQMTRSMQVALGADATVGLGATVRSTTVEADPVDDTGSWSVTVTP